MSFSVAKTDILYDINIAISSGEIVSLIGPNGSGKSSLIKLLAGDDRPSNGSIFYDGLPLNIMSIEKRAKVRSVMSQSLEIMFDFMNVECIHSLQIRRSLYHMSYRVQLYEDNE